MSNLDLLSAVKSITIFPGENVEELTRIEQVFLTECDPQSYTERVIVRELVATIWEELRFRRIRDNLIMSARINIIQSRLTSLLINDPEAYEKLGKSAWDEGDNPFNPTRELAERFVRGDAQAQERILYFLTKYKITQDEIVAEAAAQRLDQITVLEKTIADIVRRRDKCILDLDRRKERREKLRALASSLAEVK